MNICEEAFVEQTAKEHIKYIDVSKDGTYLLLTPRYAGLMVGFNGFDLAGNAYEMKRYVLFKGYEDA